MKPGDIVKQSEENIKNNDILGIIIDINELPEWMTKKKSAWTKIARRTATVMWANGKIEKTVSESKLEVVVAAD